MLHARHASTLKVLRVQIASRCAKRLDDFLLFCWNARTYYAQDGPTPNAWENGSLYVFKRIGGSECTASNLGDARIGWQTHNLLQRLDQIKPDEDDKLNPPNRNFPDALFDFFLTVCRK